MSARPLHLDSIQGRIDRYLRERTGGSDISLVAVVPQADVLAASYAPAMLAEIRTLRTDVEAAEAQAGEAWDRLTAERDRAVADHKQAVDAAARTYRHLADEAQRQLGLVTAARDALGRTTTRLRAERDEARADRHELGQQLDRANRALRARDGGQLQVAELVSAVQELLATRTADNSPVETTATDALRRAADEMEYGGHGLPASPELTREDGIAVAEWLHRCADTYTSPVEPDPAPEVLTDEPGPEVTEAWDKDGDRWIPNVHGGWSCVRRSESDEEARQREGASWPHLSVVAPITTRRPA